MRSSNPYSTTIVAITTITTITTITITTTITIIISIITIIITMISLLLLLLLLLDEAVVHVRDEPPLPGALSAQTDAASALLLSLLFLVLISLSLYI